jgi:glycosyltransferase involved in cell wall biosynthesis
MKPIISVITPSYNSEKFIESGIETIIQQSLGKKDYEWIILDDGSIDNTYESLRKYTKNIPNIYAYSRAKNEGTSRTREEAIKLSRGKYLAFFDMDDLLKENALEATLNLMESNENIKFSYSRHKRIDSKENIICEREGFPFSRDKLLHFNFVGHLKCIDKKTHEKIKGFNKKFSRYSEDYDYILRASEILDEKQIVQNPEYLYFYRIHRENNMNNTKRMRENACLAIKESLKRKEKIEAEVFWSHKEGIYNYYDWRENETFSNTE